jgi:Ca-activated chloride channel homolog
MIDVHLLRPWWLLAILPLVGLVALLWIQHPRLRAWAEICDSHLLDYLTHGAGQSKRHHALIVLFSSLFLMILSIAGPAWYQFPTPILKYTRPQVVVLDMSAHMKETDLTPDRLSRAKFKLQDLLSRNDIGQVGMIVFTEEPFVVSPLTDDGQTISALLPMLTPDIMPVGGQNLASALKEAGQLIQHAGFHQGDILVMTADAPTLDAITWAEQLSAQGIDTSIMPVKALKELSPLYQQFANAGGGELLFYTSDAKDLNAWLAHSNKKKWLEDSTEDDIPLWRDEGRWLLIPALLLLLPVFRRGWLQRMEG